ncbi:MAG: hypothetical protein V3W52_17310 [Syntrophobacteria bacterium]
MDIKVRVKESLPEGFFGFYGPKRRYPGEEFTLHDVMELNPETGRKNIKIKAEQHFSEKWMERVDQPKDFSELRSEVSEDDWSEDE